MIPGISYVLWLRTVGLCLRHLGVVIDCEYPARPQRPSHLVAGQGFLLTWSARFSVHLRSQDG
jgi:hypothetical protein